MSSFMVDKLCNGRKLSMPLAGDYDGIGITTIALMERLT
jgi:hypothetical protein